MNRRLNTMHYESKGWKKQMTFPEEKITPDLAKELLTLNNSNRPIKPNIVKKYTKEMVDGSWLFVGDKIGISNEGKLLDGQHRLWAIVNSNTTQVFHIQSGLDPKTFDKMDIGKNRTGTNTLSMQGFTSASIVSAVVRYVSMFKAGLIEEYLTNGNKISFSNADISDASLKLDKTLLQTSATTSAKYYFRSKFMESTTIGPLFYIFTEISPSATQSFFNMLSTGDGISSEVNSSIFVLRNILINATMSGNKMTVKHRWALILTAWNFYRKNRPIKRLKWGDGEDFPKPI